MLLHPIPRRVSMTRRIQVALAGYERAIARAEGEAERRFLARRRRELAAEG
jgi:predicted RNA polymerase sigma factor